MTVGAGSDIARWHSAPTARSMRIGELTATYITDGAVQISPSILLPDSPQSFWRANPYLLDSDGYLVIGAGGLLVQGVDWSILIDTGLGPLQSKPAVEGLGEVTGGRLLDSLAAESVSPTDLSAIAITHLHADHVGWWANGVVGSGRGPFDDVPAYIGADGWHHGVAAGDPTMTPVIDALEKAVIPVADGTILAPGVSVLQTPGHTPEHTAYIIESAGQTLIAFGDVFHSVAQFAHPQWADGMDHDSASARETRTSMLQRLVEPNTYGFGVHFADVPFGCVVADRDGYVWQPTA